MGNDLRAAADTPSAHGPSDRLESWKVIAAYLRRDVRTVQRWERNDGLPVHRLKRVHRSIPYAYRAELDAWWTSRSDRSPLPAPETAAGVAPFPKPLLAAVIAAMVIGAGGGAFWVATHRPVSGAAPVVDRSVAVLAFLDLSEGMKYEEFADGMSEELVNRLGKAGGVRVVPSTDSFSYKNKHLPARDIARALRVTHVIDGSVRRSGATIRVVARLIDGSSSDIVWSETYDRPWNDILVLQDEIAGKITSAVRTSIGPGSH
jgi:TolB-like protein